MNLATKSNEAPAGITAAGAPLRIGSVALTVRDLDAMTRFYRNTIGLAVIAAERSATRLGIGEEVLIELLHDPAARLADRRQAGLFHVAFLLPERAALAHWLRHAVEDGVRLQGASDHLVSEALYLSDPEGNGIEIYRDRPSEAWVRNGGTVTMTTDRLDLDALASEAPERPWTGLPSDTLVGHVHLQVGEQAAADTFYAGLLGLDIVHRMAGASFYSSGGYHHHVAANTWNSAGSGPRPEGTTGLSSFEIVAADPTVRAAFLERTGAHAATVTAGASTLIDPWGTRLHLRAA